MNTRGPATRRRRPRSSGPALAVTGLLLGVLFVSALPVDAQTPTGLPKSLKASTVDLAEAVDRVREGWRGAVLAVGEGAGPLAVGESLVRRVQTPLKLIGAVAIEPEGALELKASLARTESAIRSLAAAAERGEIEVDAAGQQVQRVLEAYLDLLASHLPEGVLPAGAENR